MIPLDPEITPYAAMGGEAVLHALVERFYDLMDLEPRYALLRRVHPASLERARERLFWFLSGFLGGPAHYTERVGPPMLRARHLPYPIGNPERDQWMACMRESADATIADGALREELLNQFQRTADWMRNRA